MASTDTRGLLNLEMSTLGESQQSGYGYEEPSAGLRQRGDFGSAEKDAGDFTVETEGFSGEDFVDIGVSKPAGECGVSLLRGYKGSMC